MKKITWLLLVLLSAVAVQAQNLTRTAWSCMVPGDEEIEMVLNFDDDGECYIILTKEEYEDDDEFGMATTIRVSLSVPGIYNQEGRDITMSFNKKKASINIDCKFDGGDPQTRALIESVLKPELEKMEPIAKEEILQAMPAIDELRVITLSKSKMVIKNSSDVILTFYPTAKG